MMFRNLVLKNPAFIKKNLLKTGMENAKLKRILKITKTKVKTQTHKQGHGVQEKVRGDRVSYSRNGFNLKEIRENRIREIMTEVGMIRY